MKSVLISIGSWFVGVAALLSGLSLLPAGVVRLSAAGLAPLITTALIFSLAYGPSLTWLSSKVKVTNSNSVFLLTSSLILNLPVFLISLLAIGRTLLAAEAYALMISFAAMGATFGLGFLWSSSRSKRIREPTATPRLIVSKHALARGAN